MSGFTLLYTVLFGKKISQTAHIEYYARQSFINSFDLEHIICYHIAMLYRRKDIQGVACRDQSPRFDKNELNA